MCACKRDSFRLLSKVAAFNQRLPLLRFMANILADREGETETETQRERQTDRQRQRDRERQRIVYLRE